MGSIATTVEEQIAQLKKRGMLMDLGEEKAKEILLDIGYYRFGFYSNPFETDKKHNFKKGTKFSEVLALYYMDVDLRHLLVKYLNRIETNFKTNLIYHVSNKFKENSRWFVDSKIVSFEFINGKFKILKGGIQSDYRVGGFKKSIYNDYFKNNNKAIKNHHIKYKKHKYAPAWKTIEYLTFGQAITTYSALIDLEIKKYISTLYGIESVAKFENYLKTLVDLRNTCAHSNVLFDYHTKKAISSLPFLTIDLDVNHSLGSCFKVLTFFIEVISSNRKEDFLSELETIFDKTKEQYPQNTETINDIILNHMRHLL